MKAIKNNLLGIIIGGIIFGSIGITIAYQINANQISYEDTNVASAITDLYDMASNHCPDIYHCGTNYHGGLIINTPVGTTYKGVAYLDPANLETECNESNFVSETGTKTGCMRFYIYDQDDNYYYAILDHNTTAMVNTDCNENCFQKAQEIVKTDTSGWTTVYYDENDERNPRNISVTEIWEITKTTNEQVSWTISGNDFYFSGSTNKGKGYGWLFDRTKNCISYGCITNDSSVEKGYWTSDARNSSNFWIIHYDGRIGHVSANNMNYGVRPVITISK